MKQEEQRDPIKRAMMEAAKELGVDPDTKQLKEDPKKFAARLKRLIRRAK